MYRLEDAFWDKLNSNNISAGGEISIIRESPRWTIADCTDEAKTKAFLTQVSQTLEAKEVAVGRHWETRRAESGTIWATIKPRLVRPSAEGVQLTSTNLNPQVTEELMRRWAAKIDVETETTRIIQNRNGVFVQLVVPSHRVKLLTSTKWEIRSARLTASFRLALKDQFADITAHSPRPDIPPTATADASASPETQHAITRQHLLNIVSAGCQATNVMELTNQIWTSHQHQVPQLWDTIRQISRMTPEEAERLCHSVSPLGADAMEKCQRNDRTNRSESERRQKPSDRHEEPCIGDYVEVVGPESKQRCIVEVLKVEKREHGFFATGKRHSIEDQLEVFQQTGTLEHDFDPRTGAGHWVIAHLGAKLIQQIIAGRRWFGDKVYGGKASAKSVAQSVVQEWRDAYDQDILKRPG